MTTRPDHTRITASRPVAPCTVDPDRWADGENDPALRAACRGCHRRFDCAKDALEAPNAEGIWSGVFIPSRRDWRGRNHALLRLRSLAAIAGLLPADPPAATG